MKNAPILHHGIQKNLKLSTSNLVLLMLPPNKDFEWSMGGFKGYYRNEECILLTTFTIGVIFFIGFKQSSQMAIHH